MNYYPLINRTHYSLLKAFSKPADIVAKAKELGYTAVGICDYNTVAGCVEFWRECKEAGLKPILGVELSSPEKPPLFFFARNRQGWIDLMKMVSAHNFNKEYSPTENVLEVDPQDLCYNDTHYIEPSDKEMLEILVCSSKNVKIPDFRLTDTLPDQHFKRFEEFSSFYASNQIYNCRSIVEECEEFDITSPPRLPKFDCPGGDEKEYLKVIARKGWVNRIKGKVDEKPYAERVKMELDVLLNFGLAGYFLIVQDIAQYVRKKGYITQARGSAAGCLISYLLGITEIDPLQYGLSFTRFFNAGRIKPGQISLPDIDLDVPSNERDNIIAYIVEKYGRDNVAQMATFGRYQGRSSLREVLRLSGEFSMAEIKEITDPIPDEARISDQLELMDEDEKSIIMWALINEAKSLKKWAEYKDGKIQGDLAEYFVRAIRLEGTFKSQGKHAAGVIVSGVSLPDNCLMVPDKDGSPMCGFEMSDLESLGFVKLDILSLSFLDKIYNIKRKIGEIK